MTVPMSGAGQEHDADDDGEDARSTIQMHHVPRRRGRLKAKPKSRTPAMIRKMPAMMLMVAVAGGGVDDRDQAEHREQRADAHEELPRRSSRP